jgi:putative hydrolase of the HAD superfamily
LITAVFLDALGTLVELQPPAPRLRARLSEAGFTVSEERAAAGIAAEIEYYLANHLDGADHASLDDLRDRCAAVMMDALRLDGLDHATARWAMLAALEFRPYDDVVPALTALRDGGHRLYIVSNWDCSLPEWLGPPRLLDLVDAVVTSADVGAVKPDARIFERALALAGVGPEQVVHVGDSLENDVAGARPLGIRAVLLQRAGEPPAGVESVRSLGELPPLLA